MEQTPEKLPLRSGFYWVRLFGVQWGIAQYGFDVKSGRCVWYMTGHSVPFDTDDFEEIGEEVLPQHYEQQSSAVTEQLSKRILRHFGTEAFLQLTATVFFALTFILQILIVIKLYK